MLSPFVSLHIHHTDRLIDSNHYKNHTRTNCHFSSFPSCIQDILRSFQLLSVSLNILVHTFLYIVQPFIQKQDTKNPKPRRTKTQTKLSQISPRSYTLSFPSRFPIVTRLTRLTRCFKTF